MNCSSTGSFAMLFASIPNSFSALTASPVPSAASATRRTILCIAMLKVSTVTPDVVAAICRPISASVVMPNLLAVFASTSTAVSPFLVIATIAPTAMAPIAAPNRAAFFAMLIKPTASLRMVCRTPSIFLSNEDVRAFTFMCIVPTVATISPLL